MVRVEGLPEAPQQARASLAFVGPAGRFHVANLRMVLLRNALIVLALVAAVVLVLVVGMREASRPTLTIAASQDRVTLPQGVRKVAAKYARSPLAGDFIEYASHAHWIIDEPGTDKVAADILGWLARAA